MPKLILMFKDKVLNTYPLTKGDTLSIGRHPENDIVIDNLAVSGRHARVENRQGQFQLTDLGSRNGTFVNGQAVETCTLSDQDVIVIGKHMIQADWKDSVDISQVAERVGDGSTPADLSKTMMLESSKYGIGDQPSGDCLTFLAGGQGDVSLTKPEVVIGKNDDADITVSGFWSFFLGAPAAVITRQSGNYFLRHTGGLIRPKRNGTSIKGAVKLVHDDVVAIGPVKLQIHLNQRMAA